MSGIFQQVVYELGITQYRSSAYHPQSQGVLERWHQTLKNMMRIYCFKTEKDWDKGIHLLLFAACESVQESLGFSLFELVFGHTVRGPLKLLKEKLLSSSTESINFLQHVSDFRNKLLRACKLAKDNLSSTQKSMKAKYDVNTVEHNIKPGQKVFALLPGLGNTLSSRCFGPYVIEKKWNDLSCIIVTPERCKQTLLCHVSMLKPYVGWNSNLVKDLVNAVVSKPKELKSKLSSSHLGPTDTTKLTNSIVLLNLDSKLSHLEESQSRNRLCSSCLRCYMCMSSCRGYPKTIANDRGPNFIDTAKELQDMENALDQHKVEDQTVNKGVKWILTCPWCHILEGSKRSWSKLQKGHLGSYRQCQCQWWRDDHSLHWGGSPLKFPSPNVPVSPF